MKHILFVSIAFPPKNDPECLQAAKYFKYMAKDGRVKISVLTSSIPTLFMPVDPQLKKYDTGYIQKIELPIYESKLSNFILRKVIPGGIDFPDSKFSFHKQAQAASKKIEHKPDIIYSRSNPLSSAFMAYKLKKLFNVPWVMHLSDPWVDSPVHHFTGTQKKYHATWEQRFFTEADIIALTSQHTVNFYQIKYPQFADKIKFFPNVFDSEDFSNREIDFASKLSIVYTGGLSGKRTALPVLMACEELIKEDPGLADQFEILFAGPCDRENQNIFLQHLLPNVRHVGEKSYSEAMNMVKHAHVLISIDLPISNPNIAMFFPSKLLDYLLAKRKILALTSPESASEGVLKNLNSVITRHNDLTAIKHFIREAIQAYKRGDKNFFTLNFAPTEFSAAENAHKLVNLLLSL